MNAPILFGGFSASLCLVSLTAAQHPTLPLAQKNDPTPQHQPAPGGCPQGATTLCVPLDASFQVVNFDGLGGNGPADPADPCQRNDDDVTLAVNLQFTFDLFGQSFNQVFINNNGNVSFGASFATYTSTGFPVSGFPMVAPYWADVDTRDAASGVVYFKSEAHRFIVIWDHVGYFNMHSDLKNTFELIMTDGTDAAEGLGNNVCFCYDDMQWTTGDASGGAGGFGGTPATAGVNSGDGVNFFQLGRFGVPGAAYDGPGGNTDGVDYLDHKSFCFFTGQQGNNVPPIYLNPPTTCLQVPVGTSFSFNIQAIGPENNQTVTIAVNSGGLANFSSSSVAGNPAVASCLFTPDLSQLGQHNVVFTATDNFNPPASTPLTVCLEVVSISTYCAGDGAANGGPDCPCLNQFSTNVNGCLNSTTQGGSLVGSGSPSISGDTFQLSVGNLPPGVPAVFFSGTQQKANPHGGFGVVFGDGLLCVGGTIQRLGKIASSPSGGSVSFPFPGDPPLSVQYPVNAGDERDYQVWYRNTIGPCGAGFNSTNAVRVIWTQ